MASSPDGGFAIEAYSRAHALIASVDGSNDLGRLSALALTSLSPECRASVYWSQFPVHVSVHGVDADGQAIERAQPGPFEVGDFMSGDHRSGAAPFGWTPPGLWVAQTLYSGPMPMGGVIITGLPLTLAVSTTFRQLLDGLCSHIAAMRASTLAFAEVQRVVDTDTLTGLASRTAFQRELVSVRNHPAIVYLCDLDGFKLVNDTKGHAAGDALLQAVAAALRKAVRQEDMIARIGGDEFAIIAFGGPDRARPVADRLREAVALLGVGVSVGWAVSQIEGTDPDALLRLADSRMYISKKSGKRQALHAID